MTEITFIDDEPVDEEAEKAYTKELKRKFSPISPAVQYAVKRATLEKEIEKQKASLVNKVLTSRQETILITLYARKNALKRAFESIYATRPGLGEIVLYHQELAIQIGHFLDKDRENAACLQGDLKKIIQVNAGQVICPMEEDLEGRIEEDTPITARHQGMEAYCGFAEILPGEVRMKRYPGDIQTRGTCFSTKEMGRRYSLVPLRIRRAGKASQKKNKSPYR